MTVKYIQPTQGKNGLKYTAPFTAVSSDGSKDKIELLWGDRVELLEPNTSTTAGEVDAKARGRKKSLALALDKAVEFAAGAKEYNITVMHGAAQEEADALLAAMKERLPSPRISIEGQITPALVVHTGPGLIGVGIQRLA